MPLRSYLISIRKSRKKIVDIYNYMAERHVPNMYLQFETGIKVNISIDVSEYRGQVGNPDRLEGG